MSYEQKNNNGALFKNDKDGVDTRPDYRGKARVNGADVEISAWIKKSKAGTTYMSLSFQEPRQRDAKPAQRQPEPAPDFNDDIPF
jgi:uncharacterized protein (DUF736 family)